MLFRRAVLLWFATAAIAQADWSITSSTRENLPNELVEHRRTAVENAASGERATLHFALLQTRHATLRVVDQPAPPRRGLADAMRREHALAGVNGGYFDPQDAPVGLLLCGGKKISSLSKARLLGGVLFTRAGQVEIVRASRFVPSAKIQEAVQCGPLLLDNGKPVLGLNDTRTARRTFAAIDDKGSAALGYCSGVTLAQLSAILALPEGAGNGHAFVRALNLDGGSSSAFWVAQGDEAFSIPEQKTVRDFVAIVPRPAR